MDCAAVMLDSSNPTKVVRFAGVCLHLVIAQKSSKEKIMRSISLVYAN